MTMNNIKNFYVENTNANEHKRFSSLKKAIEYAVEKNKEEKSYYPFLLIHIGWYNLEYCTNEDTFETLYEKCKNIINNL